MPPPPPPGFENPSDFHQDLARDIGQQVEVMILDAKYASAPRDELRGPETGFREMSGSLLVG